MHYPVAYLDRVVFWYRFHEGNIGHNEELRLTENIRVIQKLLEQFPNAQQELGARRIADALPIDTIAWRKDVGIEDNRLKLGRRFERRHLYTRLL